MPPAAKKPAAKKAKKPTGKKPAGKKPAGKKPAAKKARKVSPALKMKYKPDAVLAAVIGPGAETRGQFMKKIWDYIKKHKLQDKDDGRVVHADAKLKPFFGGKSKVTMFEIAKFLNAHISS